MSDLIGNPKDCFSQVAAHLNVNKQKVGNFMGFVLRKLTTTQSRQLKDRVFMPGGLVSSFKINR